MRRPGERYVVASNGPNHMTAEEHDAYEAKVLKTVLSSLDDDLHDMTDEEVKQELAEAGVDLAESLRLFLRRAPAGTKESENMTVPGSIWRPVKGENPYVVVAVAKMASTEENHVVYRPVDPHDLGQTLAPVWDTTWLVPLSEWYENFVPMEKP